MSTLYNHLSESVKEQPILVSKTDKTLLCPVTTRNDGANLL